MLRIKCKSFPTKHFKPCFSISFFFFFFHKEKVQSITPSVHSYWKRSHKQWHSWNSFKLSWKRKKKKSLLTVKSNSRTHSKQKHILNQMSNLEKEDPKYLLFARELSLIAKIINYCRYVLKETSHQFHTSLSYHWWLHRTAGFTRSLISMSSYIPGTKGCSLV